MRLQDRRSLLKGSQHAGSLNRVLLWLASERVAGRTLDCYAPVQVDASESRGLVQKANPIVYKALSRRVLVLLLARYTETRHHACVLVKSAVLRDAP